MSLGRSFNCRSSVTIDHILILAILILIFCLVHTLYHDPYVLEKNLLIKKYASKENSLTVLPSESRHFSDYQTVILSRQLFGHQITGYNHSVSSELPEVPSTNTFDELLSKLTLIGIISVEGQTQSLVRDQSTGKSYFCSEGDMIGQLKIKKILPNKIIFEFNFQEKELNTFYGSSAKMDRDNILPVK